MADTGVQSPNLPRATTLDSILGNSGDTTSRQFVTDLAAQLVASEPMRLGTMMGQLYNAYTDLPAITAQVTPWVIADPDPAKIGIYKVSGAAWVWALPLPYSIIPATIDDGDTVNVRQLITALPVVDGTAIIIPVVGTNTASPVVVHINGGDAITLKSNSGTDIDEGGLPSAGRLMAIREGSFLRLNNDVVATAVLAATETARDLAKGYSDEAKAAAALAFSDRISAKFYISTTATEAENRAGLRQALDLGPVSVGPGVFPLSWFEWKSGDDLLGSGESTLFVSSSGPVCVFGAIKGNSFNSDKSPRHAIETVARGDQSLTLSIAGAGSGFVAGDLIAILSDVGYSDGFGDYKPAFQQIALITDVVGDVLTLEHAIYRDAPSGANMVVVRGQDIVNSEGVTNGLTKGLNVRGFAVSTATGDSWTRFGGTYKSTIGPIWVKDSDVAFAQNGFAHSDVIVPQAMFRVRLQDAAFFCHESSISFGAWSDDPSADNGGYPLLDWGEACRDIQTSIGVGYASNPQTRQSILQFPDGAARIQVSAGSVRVASVVSLFGAGRQAASVLENPSVQIDSGMFIADQSEHGINIQPTVVGDTIDFSVGKAVRLVGNDNSTNQLWITGSDIDLACSIDMAGAVLISPSCLRVSIDEVKLLQSPSTISIPTSAQVRRAAFSIGGKDLSYLSAVTGTGTAISATSFQTLVSKTVPANNFIGGDTIKITACGICAGTAGNKRLRIRLNTTEAVDFVIPAASVGTWTAQAIISLRTLSAQRMYVDGQVNGLLVAPVRLNPAINALTTAITVTVGALVDNAADSITPECIIMEAHRTIGAVL